MSVGGICVRGSVLDKCLAKARTADRRPGQVGGLASLVAQSRACLVVMIVAPFCSMSATKRESSRDSHRSLYPNPRRLVMESSSASSRGPIARPPAIEAYDRQTGGRGQRGAIRE